MKDEISEEEWRTIENFANCPRRRPQPFLLARLRRYYDSLPGVPRMKRCECSLHDIAVYLCAKRKEGKI